MGHTLSSKAAEDREWLGRRARVQTDHQEPSMTKCDNLIRAMCSRNMFAAGAQEE